LYAALTVYGRPGHWLKLLAGRPFVEGMTTQEKIRRMRVAVALMAITVARLLPPKA
jgi:hypothetical protein